MTHRTPRRHRRFLQDAATSFGLTPLCGCGRSAIIMRSEKAGGWRRRGLATRSGLLVIMGAGAILLGCADGEPPRTLEATSFAGQVVVSGPLRRAASTVDQLDPNAKSAVSVRERVGQATTDDNGRFELDRESGV